MEQYDVSVVIPVYNCEKYIEECVISIQEQQAIDLKRIQVILVNDGSTDNSLEICNRLKNENNELTVEIITGENQGVSATRNKGIKASKGKYIMFLDADDSISNMTISKLISFFDENNDEIDIITYPMYEHHPDKKKMKLLQRYEDYFDETRIYDIETEYEAIQPTMNIIVKNYFDDNILFDEKVNFHEDILYNTQNIMRKKKLGYVKDAQYIYRIHQESVSRNRDNPLYSFNQYMYVFEKLFNSYEDENGISPKYIQRLYLNLLRWRILQDKLLPYYLEGKEYEQACNRIIALIRKIQNQTILEFKQMDKYHKAYLIKLKGDENITVNKSYDGQSYSINDKNRILFTENKIEIVINRFKIRNDMLYVLGYLKSPILMYKKPEMYLVYEDKKKIIHETQLDISNNTVANRYKTQMEVANFYKFEYEINIHQISSISFKLIMDEKPFKTKFVFNSWVPFNSKLKNYRIYFGKYRVQYKDNKFIIKKPKNKTYIKDILRSAIRYYKIDKKIDLYRILALTARSSKKNIWIYYDRKNVFDNAYVQFKHDIKIKDKIEKYYILDGNINDYKDKFSPLERKHVVRFGSYKHKLLFLNCDKILTSFSSLQEYCPFYKNFSYYKDILKYDLIYLQHGVLHANLLKMYGKQFAPIDKFVISSQFEKENLINNYEYSKKDLICVGMPRFDEEIKIEEPENKIIFAPSWRNYLIGKPVNRKREIDVEKFKKSKYYIETMKFLTDSNFLEILAKNNIVLDYKLHPIFEPYKDCFTSAESQNVTVSIGGTDLSKCKAFITDFSYFQFDFVRLQRPIIYFMPDMEEFKAGLHTYKALDLKHEDAFGRLCLKGDDLVKEIIKLIKNNFEAEPIYKERMERFFFKVKNGKDKLYDILKEN